MTNSERQKRYRDRQKSLRHGAVTGQVETYNVTATDVEFEKAKPGYYIFEDGEPWERKCWLCGAEYSTRLELNKFCGPECKDTFLKDATANKAEK